MIISLLINSESTDLRPWLHLQHSHGRGISSQSQRWPPSKEGATLGKGLWEALYNSAYHSLQWSLKRCSKLFILDKRKIVKEERRRGGKCENNPGDHSLSQHVWWVYIRQASFWVPSVFSLKWKDSVVTVYRSRNLFGKQNQVQKLLCIILSEN